MSCTSSIPIRQQTAPEKFQAEFTTTQGVFIAEFERALSPLAVDRVYQLIKSGFYTDIAIFRVAPNFVTQFGIHTDTAMNNYWKEGVADEPVMGKNTAGTIAFARGGERSRNTQLFINLKSNSPRLDELDWGNVVGFPIVGKVIDNGMEVVNKFYDGYGEAPSREQGKIQKEGNAFLKEKYPKLDYIQTVKIVD